MTRFRRKSNGMDFQNHWLDCVVEGQQVREWCRRLVGDTGKARCIYCNVSVRFGVNPVMSVRNHALSRRHKQNRKKVQLGLKEPVDYATKQMEPKQAVDACSVLYPGMNFNCSVNLLPLGVLHKVSNQVRNSDLVSLLQWLVRPGMRKPFVDVYICFHCGGEFTSRLTLQDHQRSCKLRSPHQAVTPLGNTQVHHQLGYLTPPRSSAFHKSSGLGSRSSSIYPTVWPCKDSFISSLGLLPKKKAAQVSCRRRNTQCESIDLDDDIPISPTLPRTPKLLISHLSRDGSDKCGENSPSRVKKSLFSSHHNQTDEEANTSNTNDDNNEENKTEEKSKISHAKSLYSLDLTSPLGQFVIKHIKGDPNLHVLSDVESHCLTSAPQISAPAIKLRDRHTIYPTTFKGFSGKSNCSHIHLYKFTRRQKVEFLKRVNTGLNKHSRALLRQMKMCQVRLAHLTRADIKRWMVSTLDVTVDLKTLSAEEILFWTSPKEVPDSNSNNIAVFPCGLSFSSPNVNNVLGLKTCRNAGLCRRYSLSVANYVSEEACAEVTQNRRVVYKSLLSDSASSGISDADSSLAVVPTVRHALGLVNSSHDFTSKKLNMFHFCTSATQSQVSLCPVDMNSISERIQHHNILSFGNRNTVYPTCVNGGSDQASRNTPGDETGQQATLGSAWSDVYGVYIRTALEGETVQNSVTDYEQICSGNKGLIKYSKLEQSTAERSHLVNSKFLVKSFATVKQPSVKNVTRKRRLKSTDALKAKKRKVKASPVARQSKKGDSSHAETGRQNGQHISHRKYSQPRSKHTSLPADTTRPSVAVKVVDQRSSIHSAYTSSEKQQNSPQAGSTQNRLESYNCDAFNLGVSQRLKPNENGKCLGCNGKRVAVSSFLNGNVENCHRCIICQPTNAGRSPHLKKLHQDPKVANGKHMRTLKPNKYFSKSIKTNLAIKKSRHISHLFSSDNIEQTNSTESRSVVLPSVDSRISKTIKLAKKSFLPANASSHSEVSSQKDMSPNGLRFVSYSLPSSPQLRQSSLINTVSISRKAEVRKSLLSSFLLKSK